MEERSVPCPNCSIEMSVDTSEENIGKTVTVVCKGCGNNYPIVVIPPKSVREELRKDLVQTIFDVLETSGRVQEKRENLHSLGMWCSLNIEGEIFPLAGLDEEDVGPIDVETEDPAGEITPIAEQTPGKVVRWKMPPQNSAWNN